MLALITLIALKAILAKLSAMNCFSSAHQTLTAAMVSIAVVAFSAVCLMKALSSTNELKAPAGVSQILKFNQTYFTNLTFI